LAKYRSKKVLKIAGISAAIFVFLVSVFVYSQNVEINYLPRDEYFERVTADLTASPITLIATGRDVGQCPGFVNTVIAWLECERCRIMRFSCHDCCFFSLDPPILRCSAGDTTLDYACDQDYVFTSPCTAVDNCSNPQNCPANEGDPVDIPECQELGCPQDTEPNAESSSGEHCKEAGGSWYCTHDDLVPKDIGCQPDKTTIPGYLAEYYDTSDATHFYDIEDESPCTENVQTNPDPCYKYTVKPDYTTYINACVTEARDAETCNKTISCCRENWTSCTSILECNESDCNDRVNWACNQGVVDEDGCFNCNDADAMETYCAEKIASIVNWFVDGTAARDCFQEIDSPVGSGTPAVRFDFVAKSQEEMALVWQINAWPSGGSDDVETYFYSLVRVMEETDDGDTEVHESIVHQKSFSGSFNIWSATNVPVGVLEQGKSYSVRIYYLIPEMEEAGVVVTPNVVVDKISITAISVRE